MFKRILYIVIVPLWAFVFALFAFVLFTYCGVRWMITGNSNIEDLIFKIPPQWFVDFPSKLLS